MEGYLRRVYEQTPRRFTLVLAFGAIPFCILATATGIFALRVGE